MPRTSYRIQWSGQPFSPFSNAEGLALKVIVIAGQDTAGIGPCLSNGAGPSRTTNLQSSPERCDKGRRVATSVVPAPEIRYVPGRE